jgi:hypothetical protein
MGFLVLFKLDSTLFLISLLRKQTESAILIVMKTVTAFLKLPIRQISIYHEIGGIVL